MTKKQERRIALRDAILDATDVFMVDAVVDRIVAGLEGRGVALYTKKVVVNPRREPSSVPMTPELREEIRTVYARNPELTQSQLATMFGTNIGRIAESLR